MSTSLSIREIENPGFFRRIFGCRLPRNAYVEIENLLASREWADITADNIRKLMAKHGAKRLDAAYAKKLFAKAVQTCVADDTLSEAEITGLDRLQDLLGIRDKDVRDIQQSVLHPRFQRALLDVFRDGTVTEAEDHAIIALRKALRIDERAAREMWDRDARAVLDGRLQQAVSDERLDTKELNELDALAKNFRIAIDPNSATQEQLARFRWFWLMENGKFPEVAVPIAVQKNEVCHFSCSAMLHEVRTETVRTNYHGPSARVRIMKGVYYRIGSVKAQRITRDVLRQIDTGALYVTSKRIIFDGTKKNSVIRLTNVLGITPYSDAVEVEKASGRNPIFAVDDPEWLSVLLSSLLAQSD